VDVEISSKKNVSSSIGKGFGWVIGIFFGLMVIAVSCGILISTQANEVGEAIMEANNELEKAAAQIEEEQQRVISEMEESYKESLPIDEQNKQENEYFSFAPNSIVNSQNGLSLSLDGYKYELKSGWGKITEITVTVLNEGNNNFQPKVLVLLHDEKDRSEEWGQTKAEIDFDTFGLGVGEHVTKKALVDIAFNDVELSKKLQIVLVDTYDFSNRAIVIVETDFIVG
jgi:hypothetical protein